MAVVLRRALEVTLDNAMSKLRKVSSWLASPHLSLDSNFSIEVGASVLGKRLYLTSCLPSRDRSAVVECKDAPKVLSRQDC